MSIVELFRAAVQSAGRRASWSPFDFIEAWGSLVADVREGYAGDLYEYENDLTVRDDLDSALGDARLGSLKQWHPWREAIEGFDVQMRELLAQGAEVRPGEVWWRARLPSRAGEEMREDVKRLYGVSLASL